MRRKGRPIEPRRREEAVRGCRGGEETDDGSGRRGAIVVERWKGERERARGREKVEVETKEVGERREGEEVENGREVEDERSYFPGEIKVNRVLSTSSYSTSSTASPSYNFHESYYILIYYWALSGISPTFPF